MDEEVRPQATPESAPEAGATESPAEPSPSAATPTPTLFGIFDNPGVRRVLIGVAIGLAAVIIFFFVGLRRGRGQMAALQADYENRLKSAQTEVLQMRARLTAAENLNQLLRARGWLYRVAVELDWRNFGMANEYLKQAAEVLKSVDLSSVESDAEKVTSLIKDIESTNFEVAKDLEAERRTALNLARRMDSLIPQ